VTNDRSDVTQPRNRYRHRTLYCTLYTDKNRRTENKETRAEKREKENLLLKLQEDSKYIGLPSDQSDQPN